MEKLTAENLKSALWDTLNKVRSGEIQPSQADAIATQSREILRTVNTQLRVASQSKRDVPLEVINFSENK
jgi:hypothetical protein